MKICPETQWQVPHHALIDMASPQQSSQPGRFPLDEYSPNFQPSHRHSGGRAGTLWGLLDCLAGPGGLGFFVYGGCMCMCSRPMLARSLHLGGPAILGQVFLAGVLVPVFGQFSGPSPCP
ncbi:hypothetical protein GOODEAATRI_026339 [Goodea atripinnis]|uniref:Uncharacterized protein n=1 Tax=Goodea atripinnis TaxID=208336 RepID=A0ABV0NNC1_9TELE